MEAASRSRVKMNYVRVKYFSDDELWNKKCPETPKINFQILIFLKTNIINIFRYYIYYRV